MSFAPITRSHVDGRAADTSCNLTRRTFLQGAIATGTLARSGGESFAQATQQRIDVRHHMLPPRYVEYGRNRSSEVAPEIAAFPSWSSTRALDAMGTNGIARTILSLPQSWLHFNDVETTRSMVRYGNEFGAEVMRSHPREFGLFAALPLYDVEGSLFEIEHAFDVLKVDGVSVLAAYGDRGLDHSDFNEVFDELNRRKAIVFVQGISATTAEHQTNMARTVASLVASSARTPRPNLRFIVGYPGDWSVVQINHLIRIAFRFDHRDALSAIHKLYFNFAWMKESGTLGALLRAVPESQVLFGTDYPYLDRQIAREDDRLEAIMRDNALRLFPRPNA